MEALAQLLWGDVGITAEAFFALVAASVFTSASTAALGFGGGLAMLALLGNVLPTAAVIPVHGVIQLGSNAGRAAVFRRDAVWPWFAIFSIGAVIGTVIGAAMVIRLPDTVLQTVLGLFILVAVWSPSLGIAPRSRWMLAPLGAIGSFLTMFVGATGPLVAACLAPLHLSRHRLIGTLAALMTLQHGLKVVAFGVLGFAFTPWVPLLVAVIGAGFAGTLLGRWLLDRLPEHTFRVLYRGILTVLALRLLYSALT